MGAEVLCAAPSMVVGVGRDSRSGSRSCVRSSGVVGFGSPNERSLSLRLRRTLATLGSGCWRLAVSDQNLQFCIDFLLDERILICYCRSWRIAGESVLAKLSPKREEGVTVMRGCTIRQTWPKISLCVLVLACASETVGAIIGGTISGWRESVSLETIGDGTNHVTLAWSIHYFDMGYFYGSGHTGDSDVAYAVGITDITQIADASIFSFTDGFIGHYYDADADPDGVGDFIVWSNINTGHYGVLRIDDIYVPPGQGLDYAELDGTWWFQTDGTGNFVPEPGSLLLLGLGGLGLRRRHR